MPFSILTAIAAETSTLAINYPQTIDFSIIDTIVGAIIAITAMIVVGLILFKYGVVRLGDTPHQKECDSIQTVQCIEHSGILKDVGFIIGECKTIWLEIKDINLRQMDLRSKLPEKYASKDDLRGIQDKLISIDTKLDRYLELNVVRQ